TTDLITTNAYIADTTTQGTLRNAFSLGTGVSSVTGAYQDGSYQGTPAAGGFPGWNQISAAGIYKYTAQFTLSSQYEGENSLGEAGKLSLTGDWTLSGKLWGDDALLLVDLNGTAVSGLNVTPNAQYDTRNPSSLVISSLASGDYTLDIYVRNSDTTGGVGADLNFTGDFSFFGNTPDPSTTPEPATMLIFGLGIAGAGLAARRRMKK
ncbi:MAG: PEP-CTERM sorting domain-containing protein, partial [Planctomycetaceae bacterium]|nr:PEP-CTERM sorting domain-containing protein [Planctomycetaceae bacterium]